jgi:hypothetical protein
MVVINKQRLMMAFGFVLACISLPFLFGGVRFSRQSNPIGVTLRNDTGALQVDALDSTADGRIRLVLRNVSSKDINGYVIACGDRYQVTNDLSSGDRVIAPGATDKLELPAKKGVDTITIMAAMFTDGSVEGELGTVQFATQRRAELKAHLTRGLVLLNEALDSADAESPEALDRIETGFSSLPADAPGSNGGGHYAQENLLNELRDIRSTRKRNPNLNQRESLIELRDRIKRRIAAN